MNRRETESVWDYPRPPRLEPCNDRIQVRFQGQTIIDTDQSYRVLETSHPPTYYLPKDALRGANLEPAAGATFCEWKGKASYFDIVRDGGRADRAAWEYANPNRGYEALRDHIAIYAAAMDEIIVNGERVNAQEGSFYGGWITSWITGPFKGGAGTWGW
jgi:uncharacterized protein (DUF427 family)